MSGRVRVSTQLPLLLLYDDLRRSAPVMSTPGSSWHSQPFLKGDLEDLTGTLFAEPWPGRSPPSRAAATAGLARGRRAAAVRGEQIWLESIPQVQATCHQALLALLNTP
jgi:hypothetical protein